MLGGDIRAGTVLHMALPTSAQAGRGTGFAGLQSASLSITEASLLLMGFFKTVQKGYSFKNK